MPNAPREFVSALHQFDPTLRIRWGYRTSLWIIERKMPERHHQLMREKPNPFKSSRSWDLYEGWREGYVHVLSVHPSLLTHQVFGVLRESDIHAQGGIAHLNAMLDAKVATEREAADKGVQAFNESASREAHDMLQWQLGNRVAVTEPTPPLVDTGLGFKVHDRRHHGGRTQDADRPQN